MKGGREKDNIFGKKSHHHYNSLASSCFHGNTNGSFNHSYNVGSSATMPSFDHFSTHKNNNFVDHHQLYVGPSSVPNSSWFRGSNMNNVINGVIMDEYGLTRKFQNLDIGNRSIDFVGSNNYGRLGKNSDPFCSNICNMNKMRPSNGENYGFSEDEIRLSERVSGFSDSIGSNSVYGGVDDFGNYLINYSLDDSISHHLGEHYGNGSSVPRRNKRYGDRMSMYESTDYAGNGGAAISKSSGYESLIQRDGDYGRKYIFEGCKEMLNSWSSSHYPYSNVNLSLPNEGHVSGEVIGHDSMSPVRVHPKQVVSKGDYLYNVMREKMRSDQKEGSSPVAMMRTMRKPNSGDNGNLVTSEKVLHNQFSGRRKTMPNGDHTLQKTGERGLDFSTGIGNTLGSVDSMTLDTSLGDVQGNLYLMAKDQHGCRFLQKKFDDGSVEDVEMIFNEVIDHVLELMINPFGNYLIQKLLDVCNEGQKMKIVHVVTRDRGELVKICLNTHGTRVVQKLVESLTNRKQISLVIRAIEPGFLDLIKDLNGNHVVQRCLQCLSCDDIKFIFDAAAKHCVEIATHRHGCCVLQRCIAHSEGEHRRKLIEDICSNGLILAQDPFGNYVVQYIIELNIPSAAAQLISQFEGHYVHLSMQKFSSHVVEKCLKYIEESHARIVYEVLSVHHFEQLLQDPFANYVIQSALEVTKGALNDSLVSAVRPHSMLRTNPYCKKIFTRGLLKK